jgi:diguanylate cyclase (GGDEF)-like protein/PAS domain S-box-containing protein
MGTEIYDSLYRLVMKVTAGYHLRVPKLYQNYFGYAAAIALVALSLLIRFAIAPENAGLQYFTFFPAIALAAIFGGFESGLFATLLGLAAATYYFVPPYYSFSIEGWRSSLWSNSLFFLYGVIVSFSIEAMHRYRHKFENNLNNVKRSEARILLLNEVLKKQVGERRRVDQALVEQEEFFRMIAENVEDFIAVLDIEGRRLYNSPSYTRLFGDANAMKGTDSFAEIHPEDRERVKQVFNESLQYGVGLRTEYRFVLPDGSIRHMASSGGLIKNSLGKIERVVVVSHDVTERKLVEQQIRKLAFYDNLTQLPNRRLLDDRLEQAIAGSKRSGHYGAVMFVDLDNFKPLNDAHGHKAGDLLLIEVARRLLGSVRAVDTVARFGGDEFVVVLSELDGDEYECIEQAGIVAEKIRVALSGPYWLTSNSKGSTRMIIHENVGASIGVALFNTTTSAENVLKWADNAMYQAKEGGRDQIKFHEASA